MQMLQHMMPQFERLSKEGQQGRNKLNQYTRYLTILIAIIQSFAFATAMEQMRTQGGQDIVIAPGWGFRLLTICTVTAGSCFVMWLGEQITDRGVGNGSSLIITSGIVARLPRTS
jgi:preprotein translocase subunit SecY